MTVERPPFDVDACRQVLDMHPFPPVDPVEVRRLWATLVADVEALCDEVEWLRAQGVGV